MILLDFSRTISAPSSRCFDLARDIDLHQQSVAHTAEKAVGGVTSGLIGPGQTVTWEAVHFGIRWRMTSEITAFEPYTYFQDTIVDGPFRFFQHDHFFQTLAPGRTRMRDEIRFQSPFGILGRAVDALILHRHLRSLLTRRSAFIGEVAEG